MLRIAHVIESLGRGGAERLLADLCKRLDGGGFESRVFYLFPNHALRAEIESLGIACECLELRHAWDISRGVGLLAKRLRAFNPDIVHTTLQKADMFGRLAAHRAGVKHILSTLHECPYNPEVFIDNPALNPLKYALIKQVDRFTAQHYNEHFIVVSDFTKQMLQRYFAIADSRITRIYSGVDLSAGENPDAGLLKELRSEFNLLPENIVLVNVARLAPQKGQRYLLEAMKRVHRDLPQVKLLIRGEGPLRKAWKSFIAEHELGSCVQLVEGRSTHREVLHLMALADIFVFPSLFEGLGIAALEAMARGLPCIASSVGPLPEVVEHGKTGLLVPPRDPAALAEAIAALSRDPHRRLAMGKAARMRAQAIFDIRETASRVGELYRSLAIPVAASASTAMPESANASLLAVSGKDA